MQLGAEVAVSFLWREGPTVKLMDCSFVLDMINMSNLRTLTG